MNKYFTLSILLFLVACGQVTPLSKPNGVNVTPAVSADLTVHLIFVRHGFSCANLIQKFSGGFLHTLYSDPELCSEGVERSIGNGVGLRQYLADNNIKIDFLGSSSMLRAIETAYYMFDFSVHPQLTIHTLPYLAEKGITRDNFPASLEEQMSVLNEEDNFTCQKNCAEQSCEKRCPIDFKYTNGDGRSASDYKKFLNWLEKNLDSVLKDANVDGSSGPSELTMAIATHSHFMEKDLKLPAKPVNNAAYTGDVTFQKVAGGGWKLNADQIYGYKQFAYGVNDFYLPSKKEYCTIFKADRCRTFNRCN